MFSVQSSPCMCVCDRERECVYVCVGVCLCTCIGVNRKFLKFLQSSIHASVNSHKNKQNSTGIIEYVCSRESQVVRDKESQNRRDGR